MPEGDTIYRAAAALRRALAGEQVLAFGTTVAAVRGLGAQRLVRQTVAAIEPRGKHLLIWFEPSGLALHTHLRMSGSWHLYRPGERWRKPPGRARVTIEVPGWTAVCFDAPVVELLTRAQVRVHPVLESLGPDALATGGTDLDEAARRLALLGDRPVGEALLDQRILAGVGNVYKNEVLFIHRVDPWTPVAEVPDAVRAALLATAARLLRANAAPGAGARTTTGDGVAGRLHVHGRARRPCPRCATPVRLDRLGEHARLTYWCPRCQGPGPDRR